MYESLLQVGMRKQLVPTSPNPVSQDVQESGDIHDEQPDEQHCPDNTV
jgi:hypothetical protein